MTTSEPLVTRESNLSEVVAAAVSRPRIVWGTALTFAAGGLLLAYLAPDMLAPRVGTGAAVGSVGWLLGGAFSLMAEGRTGRRVRTPAGARRAGADRALHLPDDPAGSVGQLIDWIVNAPGGFGPLRIAMTATNRDFPTRSWAIAAAARLASAGTRVLIVDLQADPSRPGLSELRLGRTRLTKTLRRHRELPIALIGPGAHLGEAARHLPTFLDQISDAVIVVRPTPAGGDGLGPVDTVVERLVMFAPLGRATLGKVRSATTHTGGVAPVDVVLLATVGRDPVPVRAYDAGGGVAAYRGEGTTNGQHMRPAANGRAAAARPDAIWNRLEEHREDPAGRLEPDQLAARIWGEERSPV